MRRFASPRLSGNDHLTRASLTQLALNIITGLLNVGILLLSLHILLLLTGGYRIAVFGIALGGHLLSSGVYVTSR